MTDATYTHIAFLLDRSGSMQSIKSATEVGFDTFVTDQRSQPGRCTVTLAQFDDEYDVVSDGIDIADVPPLHLDPRGSTALLDSIGRLVRDTGVFLAAFPEPARPGTVIVGIMTDGQENASTEWTRPAIRSLIEEQEAKYGWSFSYLGANQDAVEVGTGMGISADRSLTYDALDGNVDAAFVAYSAVQTELRSQIARGTDPVAARAAAAYSPGQRRAASKTTSR